MLNWITEFWKEHKGKIIPGLIVAIVGGLIVSALKSQQFRELAIKVLDKIQAEVTIPFYWLFTMFAFGVLVTCLLVRIANKRIKSYVMDEVHGLVWEWDNFQAKTDEPPPANLTPLCPNCWAELPASDTTLEYHCVSCGFKKGYNSYHRSLLKSVKIEIERRRRTGDWKQAKNRIKTIKNKK